MKAVEWKASQEHEHYWIQMGKINVRHSLKFEIKLKFHIMTVCEVKVIR